MKKSRNPASMSRMLVAAVVLVCLLAGCAVAGPTAIRSGRLAYNEAITETNNQQLLMAVIQNRYEETGSLLGVASVTANVRVRTRAGIQLGFGDADNYTGNLVPFDAGVVYEENPTISYMPVVGVKYASQLFYPMPVTALAQLAGTLTAPAYIYSTLVSSVNGIRNPSFLFPPDEPDPRFDRFVLIMTTLTRAGRLHWAGDLPDQDDLSLIIDHYAPTYVAEVNELLRLLGLPAPKDHSAPVILPVSLALDGRESGGIGIITRSIYTLMEMLSAAIEVPEKDQHNGATASYPALGLAGKDLRVRYSSSKPEHATVAVKYRDGWYFIDETDSATKRFFRLASRLWSIAIAESTTRSPGAPVLTVPVSR